MKFDFPALGTHWWVEVWDEVDERTAGKISDFARLFVANFEQKYSRFLPDSEISRLNRDRTLPSPSAETRALLGHSIELYRHTRGVFNVMVGHILEARGYDGAYSFIDKGSAGLEPGNPLTDLSINEEKIELLYGNIDIGGYGKGWCIDKLAEQLKDQFGLKQFLINGGGDIYVTQQGGQAVEIFLEDPLTPGKIVSSTKIMNRGFAASSPHKRRWPDSRPSAGGTDHTHIVSTEPIKDAIYLTAPTATAADAFATTLLQVDDETAERLAEENSLTIL